MWYTQQPVSHCNLSCTLLARVGLIVKQLWNGQSSTRFSQVELLYGELVQRVTYTILTVQ